MKNTLVNLSCSIDCWIQYNREISVVVTFEDLFEKFACANSMFMSYCVHPVF